MSAGQRQIILEEASVVVENYYAEQKGISIEVVDPTIFLDHYVMNLSAESIPLGQFNITRTEVINELPRGLIVPISKFEKWDNDQNYESDPSLIRDANGRVLRAQEPGYIASFLNRQFSRHGLAVLRSLTGVPKNLGLEISKIFNFTGEKYTHSEIMNRLVEVGSAKQYATNPLIAPVIKDLRMALAYAEGYFHKELSERADAIMNGLCKALDPQHRQMCKWAGLSEGDFEISTQNQALATQKLLMNMFPAAVAAQQPQMAAAPTVAPEIPKMMELLAKTTQALKDQAEQNKQMAARLAQLEQKDKKRDNG